MSEVATRDLLAIDVLLKECEQSDPWPWYFLKKGKQKPEGQIALRYLFTERGSSPIKDFFENYEFKWDSVDAMRAIIGKYAGRESDVCEDETDFASRHHPQANCAAVKRSPRSGPARGELANDCNYEKCPADSQHR